MLGDGATATSAHQLGTDFGAGRIRGSGKRAGALNNGLHAMMFSDNVSIEDEVALKREAKQRGLLMMGPDCGTAIIGGVPLAFANVVLRGRSASWRWLARVLMIRR